MTRLGINKKGNPKDKEDVNAAIGEFEAELEKELYLYDPESYMPHRKYEDIGEESVQEAEEAEVEEAEEKPKQMEWD
jgi:hypothetical protein